MDRRLPRRSARHRLSIAVAALALAVPGVSACGFDYATDRENTIVNGTTNQEGEVDVLNAIIASSEEGSGTLLATLSNNSGEETVSLESISFGSNSTVQVASFSPIEVAPQSLVNLATAGQGIKVTGEFAAGEFIELSLGFDNGEAVDMAVHVVAAEDEYAGLDNGTGSPSPAGEPAAEPTAEPTADSTAEPTGEPSAEPTVESS